MDVNAITNKAKKIVVEYFNLNVDKTDKKQITEDQVFIVWFSKTLQNWKALLSTTNSDGMYYELTYNGDQGVTYLDAYKKWENKSIVDSPNPKPIFKLSDTVKSMMSDDYKERFKAEYSQVMLRAIGLQNMLYKHAANKLNFKPLCSVEMLHGQLCSMVKYSRILEERAIIENIELPNLEEELTC